MTEADYDRLILQYERLELYVKNKKDYDLMPPEKVMYQKRMLWAIKEIYQSPHKTLIEQLKRKKMALRYEKTKKYVMQKQEYQLVEIINYFIVCLHEELENIK